MAQERSVAIGIFQDLTQARTAVEALRGAGYNENQIGFLTRASVDQQASLEETTNDAASGAVKGGLIGGALGAVAALAIPGFGPAIAGGIIVATLSGAAIGSVAGSLISVFTDLGATEDEARYYQEELKAGRAIVTVKSSTNDYADAMEILRQTGAINTATQDNVQNPTNYPDRDLPNDLPPDDVTPMAHGQE
jgi:uncharacterized membrane protein